MEQKKAVSIEPLFAAFSLRFVNCRYLHLLKKAATISFDDDSRLDFEEYVDVPDQMIDYNCDRSGEYAKTRVAWTAFNALANGTKEEYDYWT